MTKEKSAKNKKNEKTNKKNTNKQKSSTSTHKKSKTTMKNTEKKEKETKKKNATGTSTKKDKKTTKKTTEKKQSQTTNKTSKKEKEKKQSVTTTISSSKTASKKSRPSNKPKTKKNYEEDDELLDEEKMNEDELEEKDDFEEENEEEVTEVEEIDLSNIEPVITEVEPILEEDDEEEYVPKTRGRKKQIQPETHQQQTMEEIIRNRPLQIDPTKKVYVTKKEEEPKPYISPATPNKERYSDAELQEFKEIILQKLKETKENYEQLRKYFTHQDDHGTDDTSPTFKMIEDGSEVMTKEEIEQQLARLEKYMIDLQNALLRIENKTYGICTVTGKLIPKERLKSVPHATKSIEAKINRND